MVKLTLPNKFSLLTALALIMSIVFAVLGQAPKTGDEFELPATQALERQITGAESHRYKIRLQPEEFFQVRVEQKGVDVALKLMDGGGKTLATMDSPNDKVGPETLSFVAATSDSYLLEVIGLDAKAEKGNYTIRREVSRTAMAIDRKRVAVEQLFVDGVTARDTEGQRETAIAKLGQRTARLAGTKGGLLNRVDGAGPQNEQATAKYDEATALVQQGTKESLQASITKFQEARQLYSELGDKRSEAHVLNELGTTYGLLGENQKALEQFLLAFAAKEINRRQSRRSHSAQQYWCGL